MIIQRIKVLSRNVVIVCDVEARASARASARVSVCGGEIEREIEIDR